MGKKGSIKDITGQVFGRLTVKRFVESKHHSTVWECECSCGNICVVSKSHLGSCANSCGCIKRELSAARFRTHGQTESIEYQTWTWMKSRCLNPKNKRYADYGGRGIAVCPRWLHSFENFLTDMGPRPSGHSIERKDNAGNYSPDNCVWAARQEQDRNRRNNVLITYKGLTLTASEWAKRTGIKHATIKYRYHAGWDHEAIVTTPVRLSIRDREEWIEYERAERTTAEAWEEYCDGKAANSQYNY